LPVAPETEVEIADLSVARAERFLRRLKSDPFLAIVVTNGRVRIFAKDMDEEHLAIVRGALNEISEEPDAD
jgi:redox-sensitive bicupin YhaK (pirin superfamily)